MTASLDAWLTQHRGPFVVHFVDGPLAGEARLLVAPPAVYRVARRVCPLPWSEVSTIEDARYEEYRLEWHYSPDAGVLIFFPVYRWRDPGPC